LANPQRDITPEAAAEKLRSLSTVHYSEKNWKNSKTFIALYSEIHRDSEKFRLWKLCCFLS
jgi:hypothetical protein